MLLNVTARIKCDEPGCKATGEYELDFSGSAYYTRNEALHHLGWTFVEAEYSGDDDQDYCPEHSRQNELDPRTPEYGVGFEGD